MPDRQSHGDRPCADGDCMSAANSVPSLFVGFSCEASAARARPPAPSRGHTNAYGIRAVIHIFDQYVYPPGDNAYFKVVWVDFNQSIDYFWFGSYQGDHNWYSCSPASDGIAFREGVSFGNDFCKNYAGYPWDTTHRFKMHEQFDTSSSCYGEYEFSISGDKVGCKDHNGPSGEARVAASSFYYGGGLESRCSLHRDREVRQRMELDILDERVVMCRHLLRRRCDRSRQHLGQGRVTGMKYVLFAVAVSVAALGCSSLARQQPQNDQLAPSQESMKGGDPTTSVQVTMPAEESREAGGDASVGPNCGPAEHPALPDASSPYRPRPFEDPALREEAPETTLAEGRAAGFDATVPKGTQGPEVQYVSIVPRMLGIYLQRSNRRNGHPDRLLGGGWDPDP